MVGGVGGWLAGACTVYGGFGGKTGFVRVLRFVKCVLGEVPIFLLL